MVDLALHGIVKEGIVAQLSICGGDVVNTKSTSEVLPLGAVWVKHDDIYIKIP